jgi:hypothetical protein
MIKQKKRNYSVGNDEDECAIDDDGACLKPSRSSIKYKFYLLKKKEFFLFIEYFCKGVCCDACERWFHFLCVDLIKSVKKKKLKKKIYYRSKMKCYIIYEPYSIKE